MLIIINGSEKGFQLKVLNDNYTVGWRCGSDSGLLSINNFTQNLAISGEDEKNSKS